MTDALPQLQALVTPRPAWRALPHDVHDAPLNNLST